MLKSVISDKQEELLTAPSPPTTLAFLSGAMPLPLYELQLLLREADRNGLARDSSRTIPQFLT